MNKATMKELSGCIPPLRMLCSQCEPLTYHGAKDGLQRPNEGLEVGELFVFSEHATTERKPGQAQPDEPDRLGINLGDGEAPVWINFGQWRKLRAYADAVFVADDPECLAHVDGSVLLEAQEKIKTLTRILWDKVHDLENKRYEAKEIAKKAEDLWFPDHKKPNGPLFGDAPIDEAPTPEEELEEYEPKPITDEARMLGPAVFTGGGQAVTSNGTTYHVEPDGSASPIDEQQLGEDVVDAEFEEVEGGLETTQEDEASPVEGTEAVVTPIGSGPNEADSIDVAQEMAELDQAVGA